MELLKRFTQGLGFGKADLGSPWRTPRTLDRGNLGEAGLALDGQGQGFAIWENQGQLWTMPVGPSATPALVRLPMGEGTTPQIQLNPDGRGIALWQEASGAERHILGKIIGGGENHAHLVYRTAGKVRHLQAAVDRRGNALMVWLVDEGGRVEVRAQAFDTRAAAWEQDSTNLGIPSLLSAEPRIAVNQRQHAMVLWEICDASFEGLVASHYWPSERIWSDRPVPVVSHATRHHQVAMDDNGNAVAVWVHAPYGKRCSLEASYYDAHASEWSVPVILSTAESFSNPQIVMSGQGEALAAWCQGEGHGPARFYAKAFGSGQWVSGLECLEFGQEPVQAFCIDLGSDGQAGILAVHRGAEGDWVSARLRKKGWSNPIPLASPSKQSCTSPRLKLCPQGASALWIQGQGREKVLHLAETR